MGSCLIPAMLLLVYVWVLFNVGLWVAFRIDFCRNGGLPHRIAMVLYLVMWLPFAVYYFVKNDTGMSRIRLLVYFFTYKKYRSASEEKKFDDVARYMEAQLQRAIEEFKQEHQPS